MGKIKDKDKPEKLLSRDAFKTEVFLRDKHTCVFCKKPAVDPHHILDRKLWVDGGYYLSNGASVCEEHHLLCESTQISVEDVRIACKISNPKLPPSLSEGQSYDKWGNPILPDGTRLKGSLFEDLGVQRSLSRGGMLCLFIKEDKSVLN